MVFTVLANIVLCPFSHILAPNHTSVYVLVQDVSKFRSLLTIEVILNYSYKCAREDLR